MTSASKEFELTVRKLVDSKYERDIEPGNPIHRLLEGKLPLEECREFYRTMWDSLMVFNRVLLPRLLERAPTVPFRVELMGIIAQEYGPHLDDAHPVLFMNFLHGLGVPREELKWDVDLDAGPIRAEVEYLRSLTFPELLGRIIVGESLGPVAFPAVASALKSSYGLSDNALAYFTIHSITDKKDAELLFDMVRRIATTEEDRKKVLAVIETSFNYARYRTYGCKLPGTTSYRYVRRYDRRYDEDAAA